MTVEILSLRGSVTCQSRPEPGKRKYGIPPGGAFDTSSSRLANALLGNDPWSPVLEICSASLALRFGAATTVGWTGGGHRASLDSTPLRPNASLRVSEGQILSIEPSRGGFRSYLAFPESVQMRGSELVCQEKLLTERRLDIVSFTEGTKRLRVLGETPTSALVTVHLDRMGIRLDTQSQRGHPQLELSRPVVMGAIQRTPSGGLLIHGPDGPTIGGYTVEGFVIRADFPVLAQLAPGDRVEFETVSLQAARKLFLESQAALGRTMARLGLLAAQRSP